MIRHRFRTTLSRKSAKVLEKYRIGRGKANLGSALNRMIPEHWELLEIVQALSDTVPHDDIGCVLCITRGFKDTDHDENCPWIRARKITGDLK